MLMDIHCEAINPTPPPHKSSVYIPNPTSPKRHALEQPKSYHIQRVKNREPICAERLSKDAIDAVHPEVFLNSSPSYSSRRIIFFLTFVLTTPPTPNAGMILHIRAAALFAQSRKTLAALPSGPPTPTPDRLYKSSPSKCSGVESNCTAAGVMNCAALALLMYLCTPSLMCCSILGASSGGRLKDAKMVMQSRTVKRAKVGSGTGRFEPVEPNN